MALLRNPKADPKILKELEDIKRNFREKQEKEKQQEEEQKLKTEKSKKNLRVQLQKRANEQGVEIKDNYEGFSNIKVKVL